MLYLNHILILASLQLEHSVPTVQFALHGSLTDANTTAETNVIIYVVHFHSYLVHHLLTQGGHKVAEKNSPSFQAFPEP